MAHTEQELSAITAKALRPIAAALSITGTSRMVKADIVSAIIAAEEALEIGAAVTLREKYEGTPARYNPEVIDELHTLALKMDEKRTIARAFLSTPSGARLTDDEIEAALQVRDGVNARLLELAATPLQQTPRNMPYGGHWSMSFPLARGGDGNVMQGHADYCAAWGHATETHDGVVSGHCPRCGALLSAEQIEAKREELRDRMIAEVDAQIPAMLCAHGIDARRRCSICVEDTAPVVLNETITRDDNYSGHWVGAAYITHHTYGTQVHRDLDSAQRWNEQQKAIRPAEASGTVTGRITRHLAEEDAPMIEVERALKPEYFARRTRRGVETVVVERAHCGRVDYRIIDAKTGRRSSVYRMRELTFRAQYVKVPS